MARRHKLTTAGRGVVFVLVIALIGVIAFFGYKTLVKPHAAAGSAPHQATPVDTQNAAINLSLDEWIGWKPIIDANGGLSTQPGSIFDQLGVAVNIHIINDADSSSNALIKGEINAAGYTVNRAAFLSGKFKSAGLDVVMPVFTNYSSGGDGIIATNGIQSIEDLTNAKIGVPKYSEAQTLVIWFVQKSDLPDDQKKKIINNLLLLDDPEQCGQAFFSGALDVAATWQPFLSNAENSTDSHVLFSTKSSNKLILDGIVFRRDFAEANKETVAKFIDGVFQAGELYTSELAVIRSAMPMMAGMTDKEIKALCGDAGLMGYAENKTALTDDALLVYQDMCDIWETIGESVNRDASTMFDPTYLARLDDQYGSLTSVNKPTVTSEQKSAAIDTAALLTKTSTVTFVPQTAKFMDSAAADESLRAFVEIAKMLDGTIIQIEGNINSRNGVSGGSELSEQRAKAVANYFIANGIDASRIVTIGNDNKKMLVDPDAPNCEINRRTDVFFKTIEQ